MISRSFFDKVLRFKSSLQAAFFVFLQSSRACAKSGANTLMGFLVGKMAPYERFVTRASLFPSLSSSFFSPFPPPRPLFDTVFTVFQDPIQIAMKAINTTTISREALLCVRLFPLPSPLTPHLSPKLQTLLPSTPPKLDPLLPLSRPPPPNFKPNRPCHVHKNHPPLPLRTLPLPHPHPPPPPPIVQNTCVFSA